MVGGGGDESKFVATKSIIDTVMGFKFEKWPTL